MNSPPPSPAPEAAPEDLTAVPLSFMSIFLSWYPPPEEFHNGIIIEYHIQYTPSGSSLPVMTAFSTDTKETLTDLVCFTEYNIEVSARTAAPDFGPSAPATIRTLNFSKCSSRVVRHVGMTCFRLYSSNTVYRYCVV